MREKTIYGHLPKAWEVKILNNQTAHVFLRENIEQRQDGEDVCFAADEYVLTVTYSKTLEIRIAANFDSWLARAKSKDYEAAACQVRKKRNQMLDESDKEMCLDRIGVTKPNGAAFTDWITFLQQISSVMFGEMAKYRQALRDITKQEGFPYDVKFPNKPDK